MDKKDKETNRRLVEEKTDMLGSARMVTIKGQPFLDNDGDKTYVKYEEVDEDQGKRKFHERQDPKGSE